VGNPDLLAVAKRRIAVAKTFGLTVSTIITLALTDYLANV
jgi:hypothetical protein